MNYQQHPGSARARGASPWTLGQRVRLLLWEYAWLLLCAWTPKPLNPWRLLVLRSFGAQIEGRPFVHQRARIQIPWHIRLGDQACVGDRATLYSLDTITIGPRAVIAQEAYLCTGTHDFDSPELPLLTAPIVVEAAAFVGARAFVLPGLTIGPKAVIGACAVVTRPVPAGARARGNPARIAGSAPTRA
jgi:putative colanic acid biosynthesis acetyltransferase WcaF